MERRSYYDGEWQGIGKAASNMLRFKGSAFLFIIAALLTSCILTSVGGKGTPETIVSGHSMPVAGTPLTVTRIPTITTSPTPLPTATATLPPAECASLQSLELSETTITLAEIVQPGWTTPQNEIQGTIRRQWIPPFAS
jgi:hypothetical protein